MGNSPAGLFKLRQSSTTTPTDVSLGPTEDEDSTNVGNALAFPPSSTSDFASTPENIPAEDALAGHVEDENPFETLPNNRPQTPMTDFHLQDGRFSGRVWVVRLKAIPEVQRSTFTPRPIRRWFITYTSPKGYPQRKHRPDAGALLTCRDDAGPHHITLSHDPRREH